MYLLDSNILIYYLDGQKDVIPFVERTKSSIFISVISVTELLAKPSLTKKQQTLINNFLSQFNILDFDITIARQAAAIKRKYGLTFPDAVLAATAKVFKLNLVSKDRAFKKVKEVRVMTV